jgi:hypothetical protein
MAAPSTTQPEDCRWRARRSGALALFFCCGLAARPGFGAEPIAVTDGETPGTRIEVTELRRVSGGVLTLKFHMVNESDNPVVFNEENAFGANTENLGFGKFDDSICGVHLVDGSNKKKHLVIRDGEGNCLCSRDLPDLEPGSRMSLWAKFAAPPDTVDRVSVVVPHFVPMDDVPIGP